MTTGTATAGAATAGTPSRGWPSPPAAPSGAARSWSSASATIPWRPSGRPRCGSPWRRCCSGPGRRRAGTCASSGCGAARGARLRRRPVRRQPAAPLLGREDGAVGPLGRRLRDDPAHERAHDARAGARAPHARQAAGRRGGVRRASRCCSRRRCTPTPRPSVWRQSSSARRPPAWGPSCSSEGRARILLARTRSDARSAPRSAAAVSFALGESHALPATLGAAWPLLYLTVGGSLGAYVLMSWLLNHWSVTRTAYVTVIVPVIALALGALVRHERLAPDNLGGAALVLAGLLIGMRPERRPEAYAAPDPEFRLSPRACGATRAHVLRGEATGLCGRRPPAEKRGPLLADRRRSAVRAAARGPPGRRPTPGVCHGR